jgi:predicted ATP-dependent protease
VLAIGGVLPKLQAAMDAGCSKVIMPKENEVRFVSSIEEVLAAALLG